MDRKTKNLRLLQNSKLLNWLNNVNYFAINSEGYTWCILILKINRATLI